MIVFRKNALFHQFMRRASKKVSMSCVLICDATDLKHSPFGPLYPKVFRGTPDVDLVSNWRCQHNGGECVFQVHHTLIIDQRQWKRRVKFTWFRRSEVYPNYLFFRAFFEDVFSGLYRAMLCKRLPLISNSQHLLLSRDSLTQWWRAIVRESPGQLRPGGGEEGTGVLF